MVLGRHPLFEYFQPPGIGRKHRVVFGSLLSGSCKPKSKHQIRAPAQALIDNARLMFMIMVTTMTAGSIMAIITIIFAIAITYHSMIHSAATMLPVVLCEVARCACSLPLCARSTCGTT